MVPATTLSGVRDRRAAGAALTHQVHELSVGAHAGGCHLSPRDRSEPPLSLTSPSCGLGFTKGLIHSQPRRTTHRPFLWSHRRERKAIEVTTSLHFPSHLILHLMWGEEVRNPGSSDTISESSREPRAPLPSSPVRPGGLSPQSPPDILGTVVELSPAGSRAESKALFVIVVLCLHREGPFWVPRLRVMRREGGTLLSAGNLRFVSLGPRVWQLFGTHGSVWTCSRCVSPLEQRWPARGMTTACPCL